MSAEIDAVTPRGSYLEITFRGEWGGPDFLHFLPEVFAMLTSQKLRRVLLDFSGIRFQTKILFEHEFGEFLSFEFPRSVLFAVVVPASVRGCLACFQSEAGNQGSHLLVFQNRAEAVNWLSGLEDQFAPSLRECVAAHHWGDA